jgi:UDP-N-acetyl-D-mannosaminuronic acid dehydrogenase
MAQHDLIKKIRINEAKVCVLGLGYIGLPTASMFATHGLQVVGVDINDKIVDIINQGDIHIEEPGLKTLLKAAINSGNLTVKNEPEASDIFIIAVPTPITGEKKADLRSVKAAASSLVSILEKGNLVILEATSPPGTTVEIVQPILERSGLKGGVDFLLAYSPERVLPGKILHELVHNSRVIGGVTPEAAEVCREVYRSFVDEKIFLTDSTTAEMVKLMENTYRDINIAIANEFARIATKFGINVWEAIHIANQHPRVEILKPGPGVGGHCISVDPWFLVEKAQDEAQLIKQARVINDGQPAFVVKILQDEFQSFAGKTFAALGVTYKANVDDVRESPALAVIEKIMENGATVKAFDPWVQFDSDRFDYMVQDLKEAVLDVDGVLILVDHHQFEELPVAKMSEWVKNPFLLDTRNMIHRKAWQEAGFKIRILGERIMIDKEIGEL